MRLKVRVGGGILNGALFSQQVESVLAKLDVSLGLARPPKSSPQGWISQVIWVAVSLWTHLDAWEATVGTTDLSGRGRCAASTLPLPRTNSVRTCLKLWMPKFTTMYR